MCDVLAKIIINVLDCKKVAKVYLSVYVCKRGHMYMCACIFVLLSIWHDFIGSIYAMRPRHFFSCAYIRVCIYIIISLLLLCRGQKARGADTPIYDPSSGNPFGDRPSTARQRNAALRGVEVALRDLDSDRNCPDGVDRDVWNRLCNYRRQKVTFATSPPSNCSRLYLQRRVRVLW